MAADTVMTRELPALLVAPSVTLLLWAARRFRRRAPTDAELDVIVACCVVSTVLGFAASSSRWARLVTPLNDRAMPAGSFAKGTLVVLGAHWSRFGGWRRVLLPALFVGWAAATTRREPRTPAELLAGAIDLVQAVAATWRFTDLVDGEVDHLEAALQAEFTAACEAARRQAAHEELDRYARQLAIARAAPRRPGRGLGPHARRPVRSGLRAGRGLAGAPASPPPPPGPPRPNAGGTPSCDHVTCPTHEHLP